MTKDVYISILILYKCIQDSYQGNISAFNFKLLNLCPRIYPSYAPLCEHIP